MARVAAVGCAMLVPVDTWAGLGESRLTQKNVKYQALSHVHTHHSGLYQVPPHNLHWSLHLPLLLAPLDTSSPKFAASLAGLTGGRVHLLGFLPGPSSSSPCHRHAATGPWQMGLRN